MKSKDFYKIAQQELNSLLIEAGFKSLPGQAKWQSEKDSSLEFSVHFDRTGWTEYTGGRFIYRLERFDAADEWRNATETKDLRPDTIIWTDDELEVAVDLIKVVVNKMRPYTANDELAGYLKEYGQGSSWDGQRVKKERWFIFYDEQDVRAWMKIAERSMLQMLKSSE